MNDFFDDVERVWGDVLRTNSFVRTVQSTHSAGSDSISYEEYSNGEVKLAFAKARDMRDTYIGAAIGTLEAPDARTNADLIGRNKKGDPWQSFDQFVRIDYHALSTKLGKERVLGEPLLLTDEEVLRRHFQRFSQGLDQINLQHGTRLCIANENENGVRDASHRP